MDNESRIIKKQMSKVYKIAVIGQGYVGLPLAIEFSKHFSVLGFVTKTCLERELVDRRL